MIRQKVFQETNALMLGHAIADALGVPVEFLSREQLQRKPVTDYIGYGTHDVPAGTWSDDTSMALATLDSLRKGVDYDHMMECFLRWERNAAYTATDELFDIGITTAASLRKYRQGRPALECGGAGERDNGNGSLMRIIPAVLYCRHYMAEQPMHKQMEMIHNVSCLTHRHLRSQIGCGIYCFVLRSVLDDPSKDAIYRGLQEAQRFYAAQPVFTHELEHYLPLFSSDLPNRAESEIISGGYVVTTLEAALWCALTTDNYRDCVLKAVNLGHDTDTVGAVAGGLAAALYGLEGIPQAWQEGLLRHEVITELCHAFADVRTPHEAADAHCHIVCGVDDGCRSLGEALQVLREAKRQGTKHMICTSHHWGTWSQYDRQLFLLQNHAEALGIKLYPGSEIACDRHEIPAIQKALQDGTVQPLGDSKFILVEFLPNVREEEFFDCLSALDGYAGYRVIVAHVERCKFLADNSDAIRRLKEMGTLLQVNAYSLAATQHDSIKRLARTLLEERMITIIGSDAHAPSHRPYHMEMGVNYIYDNCPKDYADSICLHNALSIVGAVT